MYDSINTLLAALEQGEATPNDVYTLKLLIDKKTAIGLMTPDLEKYLLKYIDKLEKRYHT